MIKLLLKTLFFTLVFLGIFLLFLPKQNLYFLLEKELLKKQIFISEQEIVEKYFSLNLDNIFINYNNTKLAKIQSINMTLSLFYNSVNLKNVKILYPLPVNIPSKIKNLQITYTLLNPLKIKFELRGEFGTLEVYARYTEDKILFTLQPTNRIRVQYSDILSFMQEDQEKGVFIYEYQL